MTTRELWLNIMHYGKFDRMPVIHWEIWAETKERWSHEGLAKDANPHKYLNAVPMYYIIEPYIELYPGFEEEKLDESDEWVIMRDGKGVISKSWKNRSCIPQYLDHTLKDASNWDEYKRRLQPNAERLPKSLDGLIAEAENSGLPIAIWTGAMMGWIRDWMGVENMAYLMYDSPDTYADMVDTISDLVVWMLDQVLPRMKIKPDMGFGWEDICGKTGPLVSPWLFDRLVAPGYRKIRAKLDEYGVPLYGIDTDGDIEALAGHWLEAGVNVQFPVEIGTWNGDPMKLRKKYGRELRIIGGFNKLTLEKGPRAIDEEIERRIPLMKEGGFVIQPDHFIQPGVSLENYKYYLERIRGLRF